MSTALGIIFAAWGLFALFGSIIAASRDRMERSSIIEITAALWFILAALCFRW